MLYHPHLLCIPILRRNFRSAFSQELLFCETNSRMNASQNATILTTSSQRSVATHSPYYHNLHFLLPTTLSPKTKHHKYIAISMETLQAYCLLEYHYFYRRCSYELHSLVLPVQTFTANTCHACFKSKVNCDLFSLHS